MIAPLLLTFAMAAGGTADAAGSEPLAFWIRFDGMPSWPCQRVMVARSRDDDQVERLPGITSLAPAVADAAARLEKIVAAAKRGDQGSQGRGRSLALASGGKARYAVHVGAATGPIVRHAAAELAEYLENISGGSFRPLSHDGNPSEKPLLIVGRHNALTGHLCPDIPYDRLGEDGFVIRTAGPHVVIAGATPRGTLYGVYWLLDRYLGVRWFARDYTYLPQHADLVLKRPEELQRPRFTYREFFARDADDEAYRAHNLLNGRSHHRRSIRPTPYLNSWCNQWKDGDHNSHRIVSKKKYGAVHPEYFAGNQLAMMNDQVRRIAAATLIEKWKRKKPDDMVYMAIGQQDMGWNPDPASLAFAARHGGRLSAPLLDMVIDVGRRVRRVCPNAKLATSAYHWSFAPPEGMRVPDFIQMTIAVADADLGQPLNRGRNTAIARQIQGWSRICNNMVLWYYVTDFASYIQPYPNLFANAQSIKWWATIPHATGCFLQSAYGTYGAELVPLRAWVDARLMWDPTLDARALIHEFVHGYYGPAAPQIEQYVNLMHNAVRASGARLNLRTPVTAKYLSFDVMRRADQLFDRAEQAAAAAPDFLRHVRTARLGPDYAILLRRADYRRAAQAAGIDWDPDTARRLARFERNARAAGLDRYGEGVGDLKTLLAAVAAERTAPGVPKQCAGLPPGSWVDFMDMALRIYAGRLVSDPKASDHVAVRLRGNTDVWGIQMRLDNLPPDGQWKLYAAVRVEPGAGTKRDRAMSFGVHPGVAPIDLTLADLGDGQYHTIRLPGLYRHDAGRSLWFAPPNSNAVKAIFVDRVFAIRQP